MYANTIRSAKICTKDFIQMRMIIEIEAKSS